MGLLDQLGGLLEGQSGNMVQIQKVLAWVEQQGGIQVILEKFQQGGLGEIFQSWLSTGGNHAISADQINSVLGNGEVQSLASSLGVDPQQASSMLANLLPTVVDGLSPQGNAPESNDLVNAGLELLKGKLFG